MNTDRLRRSDFSSNARLLCARSKLDEQPGQVCTSQFGQKLHEGEQARIAEFSVTAEHCRPELLHLAAGVLASPEDADDVVQDALLQAFVNLSEAPPKSQAAAWLCEIVLDTASRANCARNEGIFESIEASSLHEKNQRTLTLVDSGMNAEQHYELQEMRELSFLKA